MTGRRNKGKRSFGGVSLSYTEFNSFRVLFCFASVCFFSSWTFSPIAVIGQKVNIAARMMMYYPGIVTCDSVTYDGSNLPAYFFKELPKKVMKGVADPGPVYQCLGLNEKV